MPLSTPIDVNPDTSLGLENQQGLGYTSGGGMTAVGWVDPLCGDPMFGEFSYYPAYVDPADDEIREVGTGSTPNAPATQCARSANFDDGFDLINNNVEQVIAFAHLQHNFSDSLRDVGSAPAGLVDGVRLSPHIYNTMADADRVLEALREITG